MNEIKLTIDGHDVFASKDQTVLQAALSANIFIPHLCYHPSLSHVGECKLCVVQLGGEENVQTSCTTLAENGMNVTTKNQQLLHLRQISMELMMASHPSDCTSCPKYLKCELQALMQYLGVSDSRLRKLPGYDYMTDENPLFIRDLTRCVLCSRCVRACKEIRTEEVLNFHRDGIKTWIAPQKGKGLLKEGDCKFCGSCAAVCPTGAVRDKDEEHELVPCRASCPAGTDVPRYLSLIREGDYAGALSVIRERATFPHTLGHVCMSFCENNCRNKEVSEAVGIRKLKKSAAEHGGEQWKEKIITAQATGKKVAVIGAGPAGLTVAYYLARKGHFVDVYERLPFAGGMLSAGIPKYRLPAEVVQNDIKHLIEAGINLHLSKEADNPKKLLADGHDAVVLAIGAHKGLRLPIPGNELPGVATAVDFLRETPEELTGKNVVVLGGGNVAFDCARSAIRLGASKVTVACLESRSKMAASAEEIECGVKEGIELLNSRSFERIEKDNQLNVFCTKINNFTFEEGTLVVEPEPNSEHTLIADVVIFATGQKADYPAHYEIDIEGVFQCGDCVSGTASVIEAVASGRSAAETVDKFLGGNGDITEIFAPKKERKTWSCQKETADSNCEASQCLQCDLRLQIPKVKFWSEYALR